VGAARLGIDLSVLRMVENVRQAPSTVLAAVARGDSRPPRPRNIAERADAQRARPGASYDWSAGRPMKPCGSDPTRSNCNR
jgi:hypothetical protein